MGFSELQAEVRRLYYDRLVEAAAKNKVFLSTDETPNCFVWIDASDSTSLNTLFESFDDDGPQVELLLRLQDFATGTGTRAERAAITRLLGALRIVREMARSGQFRKLYHQPDRAVLLTIKISIQQWYFAMRTFLLAEA